MKTVSYYSKAIDVCEAMLAVGLASVDYKRSAVFISPSLEGQDRADVEEAFDIYLRTSKLMSLGVRALQVFCAAVVVYRLMA